MSLLSKLFGKEKDTGDRTIDRRVVETSLKATLWPMLKANGFQTFRRGSAWRHTESRIDVVQIEFFDKEHVAKWGITPFSFAFPIGCFFPFIPAFTEPSIKRDAIGLMLPSATSCPIRKTPVKSIKQRECKITNIWYIDPHGKYIEAAIADIKNILDEDLLPWFVRFNDLNELLRGLLEDPEFHTNTNDNCWGYGKLGSPIRSYLTGFTALKLQKWELALDCLQRVLASGGLAALAGTEEINTQIKKGISQAEAGIRGLLK